MRTTSLQRLRDAPEVTPIFFLYILIMKLIPEGVSEQDLRLVDEETVNVENRLGLSLSTWESK